MIDTIVKFKRPASLRSRLMSVVNSGRLQLKFARTNLSSVINVKRLEWQSNKANIERCQLKQKSESDCENYVRVIAKLQSNEYLICGTNSFNPLCRTYQQNKSARFEVTNEESGTAKCPFGPSHNSTILYTDDRLYSATTADWSSQDSLIYSQPLRTEQHNSQWLNDAQFVGAFDFGEKVYFFLREIAVENINCGKVVLSRVAQVCKGDTGGNRVLRQTWTSFFKARLNCSIPGLFPFYFDEIHSISDLGRGNIIGSTNKFNRTLMVYAVFTTPTNSIRGSAICAFKLSDIVKTFEGPFKEQKTPQSNWLAVSENDTPQPHPALVCLNDTLQLPDQTLNFIKTHPLMDQSVPAFGGQPVVVSSGSKSVFKVIAVDWQVLAADHKRYDVIFIGTEDGRLLKLINRAINDRQMEPVVIEVMQIFRAPIVHIKIYSTPEAANTARHFAGPQRDIRAILVASLTAIVSLPLHRCYNVTTCSDCVALRDPYCSWYLGRCTHSVKGYQSVDSGLHPKCVLVTAAAFDKNVTMEIRGQTVLRDDVTTTHQQLSRNTSSHQISGPCYTVSWPKAEVDQYSTEAMAIATTICSLLSLTVGCTLGYSVAMSRHSTVGDVINDAARPTTNWTTGSPSSYQRHVTTKSQLIAVLNERYSTADVTHELLRLQ